MEHKRKSKALSSPNEINENDAVSFIEIWNQIRIHRYIIIIVTTLCLAVAVAYALFATDIYQTKTVLKIEPPKGSILGGGIFDELQSNQNDRYIANEMELLKSYTIREHVAKSIVDSFDMSPNPEEFFITLNRDYFNQNSIPTLLPEEDLVELFSKKVEVTQKRGLDFIEITIESPSPKEAALMANAYADVYLDYNLQLNRQQFSHVTGFLEEQKGERYQLLEEAEDTLKYFRLMAGVVELDAQATSLIETISDFETQKNTVEMELAIAKNNLNGYKGQLQKVDPTISQYLDSKSNEAYFTLLQERIAEIESQRDLAVAGNKKINQEIVDDYNLQIAELKAKLNSQIAEYRESVLSSSPEEVKELTKLAFEEEIKVTGLEASLEQLNKILKDYDQKFGSLPEATLELARLERNKLSLEKLYMLLEEKYQEALINEQSIPGNVIVIDKARIPIKPAKPNRILIVVIGLFLGLGISGAILYLINIFNHKINTPEDITKEDINLLGWIPQFNGNKVDTEFIVKENPKSIPAESYRAIRTRIQFSKADPTKLKTMLVTSSLPGEGKTTTTINIAGSFALAGKNVLIVDCDLRKPRMHTVLGKNKVPGFTDYVAGKAEIGEIIYKLDMENLFFIPSGKIPTNPSELLGSTKFLEYLELLKQKFDIVILDTAPLLPVTDTELLSKIVDASVLVLSSGNTDQNAMLKAVDLMDNTSNNFIGAVLNNFGNKYTNNSYYKYYYYYSNEKGLDNVGPKGRKLKKINSKKEEKVKSL